MIVAVLPSAAICAYETVHGHLLSNVVAYLAGMTYCHQRISMLNIILMFWILACVSALILTMVYISYHLKKSRSCQAIQTGECNEPKKEVNMKRILVGFIGVLIHLIIAVLGKIDLGTSLPINAYSSTTSLNMMLIFFVVDDNVLQTIKTGTKMRLSIIKALLKVKKVAPESTCIQI
jgi:uncharacterized protein YacL